MVSCQVMGIDSGSLVLFIGLWLIESRLFITGVGFEEGCMRLLGHGNFGSSCQRSVMVQETYRTLSHDDSSALQVELRSASSPDHLEAGASVVFLVAGCLGPCLWAPAPCGLDHHLH